jgi:hypothetical protein
MLGRKRGRGSPEATSDSRYVGKPMLALLEDYVRWCIGELPAEREASLQELVPGLQQAFATAAPTWHGCVVSSIKLPDTTPAVLQDLYGKSGAAAAVAGGSLDLNDWVQSVVDKNFT